MRSAGGLQRGTCNCDQQVDSISAWVTVHGTMPLLVAAQVGMSEYVKDLSVILAVDWCAPLAFLLYC